MLRAFQGAQLCRRVDTSSREEVSSGKSDQRARTSYTEISQPACHRQHGITVEAIRLLLHAVYRRIVPERSLVRAPRIELFQCQLFPTIDSAGPGKAQRGLRPLGLFESLLDRRQLAQPVVKAVTTRGVSHVGRRASHRG